MWDCYYIPCEGSIYTHYETTHKGQEKRIRDWSYAAKVMLASAIMSVVFYVDPAYSQVTDAQAIQAIVGEASNQGYDGMTAVGEVIRRRGSVRGVYGYNAMKRRSEPPWVWTQAKRAWERSSYSNLSKGATLFENIHAYGFPKSWDREKVVCVAVVKDHYFFIEE